MLFLLSISKGPHLQLPSDSFPNEDQGNTVDPNLNTGLPDTLSCTGIWFILEFKVPECVKIHSQEISLEYALGKRTESSEIHIEK